MLEVQQKLVGFLTLLHTENVSHFTHLYTYALFSFIYLFTSAGAVLRMLQHAIGEEAFREGLRIYLTEM